MDKFKVNLFCTTIPQKDAYANVWWPDHKLEYIRPPLSSYDGVTVVADEQLGNIEALECESRHKVAWLMEPRVVKPYGYNIIPAIESQFTEIYTHDPVLLKRGNRYKRMRYGACWISEPNCRIYDKSKMLSMVASNKNYAPGHQMRHDVIRYLRSVGKCPELYGSGYNPFPHTDEGRLMPFKDYCYSIVIENSSVTDYFTDKIVDCFATGTVPIFWGCPNIQEIFNPLGVIVFSTIDQLVTILQSLSTEDYMSRMAAIEDNFMRFREYASPDKWMRVNCFERLGGVQ